MNNPKEESETKRGYNKHKHDQESPSQGIGMACPKYIPRVKKKIMQIMGANSSIILGSGNGKGKENILWQYKLLRCLRYKLYNG
jgi:hypothetical protein